MDNKSNQQAESMESSDASVAETVHSINNMNHTIMLNTPIIKAAWNDVVLMLKEYSDKLEDYTIAGMPFEHACSIIPELIEGIENSSLRIKSTVQDLRKVSSNNQIEKK
jgi:two-component system, NtrC family, sensor kinase